MSELMTPAEVHDFGIETVFGFLKNEGHEIVSVNTELGRDPQIVCRLNGQLEFIVVRTDVYPRKGSLNATSRAHCIAHADSQGGICYFASVGIANSSGQTESEMAVAKRGAGFYVAFEGITLLRDGVQ